MSTINKVCDLNDLYQNLELDNIDEFMENLYLGAATPEEQRLALTIILEAIPVMSQMPPGAEPLMANFSARGLSAINHQLKRKRN